MPRGQLDSFMQYIRKLVGAPAGAGQSDGQLLERFAALRDEAAFTALVQRHGPMVLGVCRRVLEQAADAEDAFQATFLVLARKAGSVRKRESVGSWLYGVASRTARKARASALRRQVHERQVAAMPQPEPRNEAAWQEIRPLLDEELSQLPEKYRAPLVLCYLEGKTNEQAAQELGCPAGSMSGRLARGRELLRDRLTRRGMALSTGVLGTVLADNAVAAAVPVALLDSTIKAALLFAAGSTVTGAISAPVATLAEGVLQAMFVTKLKIAAAVLLAVGAVGTGSGVLTHQTLAEKPAEEKQSERPKERPRKPDQPGEEQPVPPIEEKPPATAMLTAKPRKPAPGDDELRKLLIARYNSALAEMQKRYELFYIGRGTLNSMTETAWRLLDSELELSDKPADQIAVREHFLELAKEVEKLQQARHDAGRISIEDLEGARYWRIDTEIGLLKAKQKAGK